ncbi:hypothetical protein GQ457_16G009700 [Hibiscus cannabinus]
MTFPFSLPPTLKRPNPFFSSQTDLKSCSAVLADEWTAPTAKHRRSSSEFGLAKGDGWLKEFEGWRFKVNNGRYYADASTAVCVIGEANLFLMGVLLNQVGMVDLSMICYFKLCFQCSYLGADFVRCGRVFTENILVVCSMICIKVMSCSITAEIALSTGLEILRVSEVLGGKVEVDFGLGKQFRSSRILYPALCTRFFTSLVFLYEGIYKALIDFGRINRATPFRFGLSEISCVPQEGPPTPESCIELHEMAMADDRVEDHPRKA